MQKTDFFKNKLMLFKLVQDIKKKISKDFLNNFYLTIFSGKQHIYSFV